MKQNVRSRAILVYLACAAACTALLCGCAARLSAPVAPRLAGLEVRGTVGATGSLVPAFAADTFDYHVDVQSDIGEVQIVPRAPTQSVSRISVNTVDVPLGTSLRLPLAVGDNVAKVEAVDALGTSQAYTVTIRRENIQPVVDSFKKLTFLDPASGMTMAYRLFVPAGGDPKARYPLVIFLHGAGESGNDNEKQLAANQGPTVWAKPAQQARHPCFVLAPQNPIEPGASRSPFGRMGWTTLMMKGFSDPFGPEPSLETAFAVLQAVMANYNVDRSRIYVTGLSMGGFGAFAMAASHPDAFAAVVGICGGLDPARAAVIARKHVWVFHAAVDPIVDVRFSRDTVQALKKAGGKPRYTEYGNDVYIAPTAHQAWIPTYASQEMRDWLFAQSR